MKRTTLFATAVAALAALAAPAAAQDQTLEVYITGLTEDTLAWFNNDAAPAFEAMHEGVNVEVITGGWGDFDATVAGWITTGDGPEIVYLGSEYAATYGSLLADISSYVTEEDTAAFLPIALETATWDGALRGFPLLMSPRPVFYRTDLAADASAVPPLTFDDALSFIAANSSVADGTMTQMGFMDIGSGLFDAQEFIAYIWSAGGELYNEDGSSAFDSAATAEALQYMYDRRRIMMPDENTAGLPPFEGTPIASNMVVSGIFPMWNMPATSDPLWENIAIAPYPAGADGEPVVQVFIDWLSVPAYVEDPTVAVEFLKFITNQENAVALSTVAGFTPTRTDAWEDLRATNPVWDALLDVAVEYGRPFSDIRASAELRPLITEQVTLFLTDQQSLETTQQNLKDEYDAILEDNGYLG
jgi:multiple sugar transport system substrate-binding protein